MVSRPPLLLQRGHVGTSASWNLITSPLTIRQWQSEIILLEGEISFVTESGLSVVLLWLVSCEGAERA